jgi:hypothetical protein
MTSHKYFNGGLGLCAECGEGEFSKAHHHVIRVQPQPLRSVDNRDLAEVEEYLRDRIRVLEAEVRKLQKTLYTISLAPAAEFPYTLSGPRY